MDNRNDLETLIELCELDTRKKELDDLISVLPAEAEDREKTLAEEREAFEKLERRLEEAQRERRRLEAVVDDKNLLLAKYRTQLDAVKTNKEYQSLQREIALTKKQISETEDKLLERLGEIEQNQSRIGERRGALAQQEKDVSSQKREAEARLRDVEVQLLEVEAKRKRLISSLSQPVRGEYQRLFEHYPGGAFTVVADGVCQGCYMNIPAKIVAELRSGGRLYRCESCGRLIFGVVGA